MKGQGTFRRIADGLRRWFGLPVTTHYTNPVLEDRRLRRKKRAHGVSSGRFAVARIKLSVAPRCRPGTITFHDRLVRHFGRREADKYGRILCAGQPDMMPTEQDYLDNPAWAHLGLGRAT